MPKAPPLQVEMIERFGPHLAYAEGKRIDTAQEPGKLVATHCCFCGQQCGINLKVKDNEVIGFEPRYNFPFNRGMLCPKGVKRYLQQGHPDRLLHAYDKDPSAPDGFSKMRPREMMEELRVASKGYTNDYSGVTWERVEENNGVFWPFLAAAAGQPTWRCCRC